ncbi:MAG: hypothetical protein RLZZ400_497 [Actinomycetota bacterium]
MFVGMGLAWAAMLARMPFIKDNLGVTKSELGFLLLCGGIGSLIGLNLVGRMIAKRGTRIWLKIFFPFYGALTICSAISIETHQPILFAAIGFLSGAAAGITDVAVNVDGTELEKITKRNLMPRLHAGFSIGTLIGSAWGAFTAAINLDLVLTVAPLALFQMIAPFAFGRFIPAKTGIDTGAHDDERSKRHWFSWVLVFFGIGILGMTLGEGGAGDWMALGFKEGYGVSDAEAGISFSVFFAGMVLVRFFGGSIADRLGKGRALQLLAATGVAGILITILGAPNVALGWLGAALWGAGVALGFPLFLSAAGEGENSARRVSFVAAWGYGAFLTGPPILGFVADHFGTLNMFYVIAAFMVVALFASLAVKNHKS